MRCLSSVYKVKVEESAAQLSTDVYSMRIMDVIKQGAYP